MAELPDNPRIAELRAEIAALREPLPQQAPVNERIERALQRDRLAKELVKLLNESL